MQMRPLGKSPLTVAPLALGGNVFGWSADEAQSFKLLDGFVDAGFNLIDTADVYSSWVDGHRGGESESVIGKWLTQSGKRNKVLIATKVGMWNEHPGLSPVNIQQAVEGSLRRLKTDHIDLYQAHEDDAETPLAETLGAFGRLIEQGKVRVIGASNYSADRLREALKASAQHSLPRYESLQPEYNLLDREGYENALEPLVTEEGLGMLGYFSLASGFLTGKYRSREDLSKSKVRGSKVEKYLNERGTRVLNALDNVAEKHSTKPVQIALAWLMARPSVTAPIASATSLDQLNQLTGAAHLELAREDIDVLDKASAT